MSRPVPNCWTTCTYGATSTCSTWAAGGELSTAAPQADYPPEHGGIERGIAPVRHQCNQIVHGLRIEDGEEGRHRAVAAVGGGGDDSARRAGGSAAKAIAFIL